jgi:Domain of unknown function (DUF4328)
METYRSPLTLSRMALVGIGVDGLFGLIDVLFGAGLVLDPANTIDFGDGDPSSIWLLLIGLISLVKFPVYFFAVVTFLMWLYRGYTNLPALRSDDMEFSPGWAVGWWFIPFANLVKPFQAVRNLWSESDPDIDPNAGFSLHVQAGAPGYMAFWWAAWLLSNFAANAAGRILDPEKPTEMAIGAYVYMIAGGLTFVAAALAIKVILDITNRQEERYRKVGILHPPVPPPPPTFST